MGSRDSDVQEKKKWVWVKDPSREGENEENSIRDGAPQKGAEKLTELQWDVESKEGFKKNNKVKDITTCFYADVNNLLQKKG